MYGFILKRAVIYLCKCLNTVSYNVPWQLKNIFSFPVLMETEVIY